VEHSPLVFVEHDPYNKEMELEALKPLKNLHEVMIESAGVPEPDADESRSSSCAFRFEKDQKALLMALCERHNTTLSAFLRGCCQQLIKDYLP
jgi:hypothetical protein